MDDIRNNMKGDCSREHIITRQDIRNVFREFNILGVEKHPNDYVSVEAWVTQMQSQEFNPVLFFKQQGIEDKENILGKDDFLLCIQTEFQFEMFKAYGHTVICIDATHSTNMYDFLLITVLVIDEFGEGVPVSWAITNKEDTNHLSVFLKKLRNASGELHPAFFMSDDAQQYWNAWKLAYENSNTKKILCAWHIDKNWRKAIRENIQVAEDQASVYHQLQVVLKETDKSAFHVELQNFMTVIMEKHPAFFQYFSVNYAGRTNEWATCERVGTVANTNMHIESFHRLLKVVYLQGKQNRRLDTLLSIVLKISRDKAFERITKLQKGKNSHRIREINKRHKKAEEMMSSGSEPIQESLTRWTVKSISSPDVTYTIQLSSHTNCECKLLCNSCQLCSHMYSCSCVDYALHYTACKHVHLVHMMSHKSSLQDSSSEPEQEPSHKPLLDTVNLQNIPASTYSGHTSLEKMREAVLSKSVELQFLVNSIDSIDTLTVTSRHLQSAVSMIKAASSSVPSQTFPVRKRPAPNENINRTQRRTNRTRRTNRSTVDTAFLRILYFVE